MKECSGISRDIYACTLFQSSKFFSINSNMMFSKIVQESSKWRHCSPLPHICDELVSFHSSLLCKFYTILKFKRINNKSFHCLLLILSGDISLNPGPVYNSQPSCSNEWNVFKAKGIHLIHLSVNSLLPKFDEIRYKAARTNAAVTGISESKLDKTILQSQIQIYNYELLRCDRNRNGGGVACYIRSDIGYIQKHFFLKEIENIFVEIILLKTHL